MSRLANCNAICTTVLIYEKQVGNTIIITDENKDAKFFWNRKKDFSSIFTNKCGVRNILYKPLGSSKAKNEGQFLLRKFPNGVDFDEWQYYSPRKV